MPSPEPTTYLLGKIPAGDEIPNYGLAWMHMRFVKVNEMPVPFKTRESAQSYMDVWNLAEQGFAIYALTLA